MIRRSLLACSSALTTALMALPAAHAADAPLAIKSIEFTATPAPTTVAEMVTPHTSSQAVVTLIDGSTRTFPLDYHVLHRSGDFIGGGYAGLITDKAGQPVMQSGPDKHGNVGRGPFYAQGADGTSLLMVPGAQAHRLYLVNHLEYETEAPNIDPTKPPADLYGALPMAMTLTTLDQTPASGVLTPVKVANVDFSSVEGVWIPCNGSTTPWQTHLGSEEYEPDAHAFESKPLEAMNLYLGTQSKTAAEGGAKPYRYGHLVEVTVKADGATDVTKHYAMGRLAFELGDVMGDQKTVYMGDDGDDVIRAMFVADKAGDLSSGTLYAAKWHQTSGEVFGKAQLSWIKLGHASDAEIKAMVDRGIKFSDIFDLATAEQVKAEPAKYAGYAPIYAYAGTGSKTELTYLKVKPGMETAAAFLETRRFAAAKGATTEFTKMEGQAHSVADKKLWTVISYIRAGMIDGKNADRPQDDIRLAGDEKDLTCGAVYESQLAGGQKDSDGKAIASDWVATDMVATIYGARQPQGAKVGKHDKCDTELVANPDNVRYSEAMRTLFIGEDSGNHLNNFTWAWNVDSKKLARLFSAPIGAENTGLSVFDNINGHAYITGNIQHPGANEDLAKYHDKADVMEMQHLVDQRGVVGYFGGLPALTR